MVAFYYHQSALVAKVIYIGDSGTGKTGSLCSLVKDGYKLRVLDMDNGLDVLKNFIIRDCPDMLKNVDYESIRDEYKVAGPSGLIIKGQPKAFVAALKLLEKWSDESIPATWGEDTILVLDSLSAYGKAAFEWAKGMNPAAKDPRQWYFAAQQAVENTIALLTSAEFDTNVIIISHVNYRESQDGTTRGYANAIGSALGPTISKYFNTLILAESSGSGTNVRRKIKTVPTTSIDLKSPVPFKLDAELPLETGLSTLFKTLKGK
jgi:AAA domain